MRGYFTRQRFGRPQFLAGLLLLAFLGQVAWLVHAELGAAIAPDGLEALRIREGWKQWTGHGIAGAPLADPTHEAASGAAATSGYADMPQQHQSRFDAEHSPLLYLASAAPLLVLQDRMIRAESA